MLDWGDIRNVVYTRSAESDYEPCGDERDNKGTDGGSSGGKKSKVRVDKLLPATRMPLTTILDLIRVLTYSDSPNFTNRLADFVEVAHRLLRVEAQNFPEVGRVGLEHVVQCVSRFSRT